LVTHPPQSRRTPWRSTHQGRRSVHPPCHPPWRSQTLVGKRRAPPALRTWGPPMPPTRRVASRDLGLHRPAPREARAAAAVPTSAQAATRPAAMIQCVAPARARVAAFDWVTLSLAAGCRGGLVNPIPRFKCAITCGSLWGVTCPTCKRLRVLGANGLGDQPHVCCAGLRPLRCLGRPPRCCCPCLAPARALSPAADHSRDGGTQMRQENCYVTHMDSLQRLGCRF
jgi:hypothetical protein